MASPEPNRARRFALPELVDDRAGRVIEAFLEGRHARGGRPAGVEDATPPPPNPLVALSSRLDWNEALRREAARSRRYRRHAAIVVLAAQPSVGTVDGTPAPEYVTDWMRRVAGPIAHVLRRGVRTTDLVTRIGEARFQLLLPESSERAAAALAERLIADCEVWLSTMGAPVTLEAGVAPLARDGTPEEAVARAWQLLERGLPSDDEVDEVDESDGSNGSNGSNGSRSNASSASNAANAANAADEVDEVDGAASTD